MFEFSGTLAPESPFGVPIAALPRKEKSEVGVFVTEPKIQIVSVAALNGCIPAIAEALDASYGLQLPRCPGRLAVESLAILGTGPRSWLCTRDNGKSLADELGKVLASTAAVTDQSDAYAILQLSGPKVLSLLEKGISIDLGGPAFPPGHSASTSCSHIGVVLWRLDDADGAPVFEIALFRSFALSFWRWLNVSSAEFGLAKPSLP